MCICVVEAACRHAFFWGPPVSLSLTDSMPRALQHERSLEEALTASEERAQGLSLQVCH